VSNLAVQTLPDAEQELAALLRAQPELGPVAARVYTVFPAKAGADPLLVVHRFGGQPKVGRPLVLDEALLQVDVYGGSKGDVARIGALVRALLVERSDRTVLGPYRNVPDETFTPPRPRALVDVTYYLRPASTPTLTEPPPASTPAMGATAGQPGTWTPDGCTVPASLAELQASSVAATPAGAWGSFDYVELGDGTSATWLGTDWSKYPPWS
jgi:hypothetical protein